jgi:hypothetical protein
MYHQTKYNYNYRKYIINYSWFVTLHMLMPGN